MEYPRCEAIVLRYGRCIRPAGHKGDCIECWRCWSDRWLKARGLR